MADFAGLGEAGGGVRRIVGALEILEVARDAGCRQSGELAVGVARGASQRSVGANQRKLGVVVVEDRIEPIRGGVADGAIGGEPGGNVVRIVCGVKCGQVTTGALRRGIHVVVVHVALRAGRVDMGAGEREFGRVVVEGGR